MVNTKKSGKRSGVPCIFRGLPCHAYTSLHQCKTLLRTGLVP